MIWPLIFQCYPHEEHELASETVLAFAVYVSSKHPNRTRAHFFTGQIGQPFPNLGKKNYRQKEKQAITKSRGGSVVGVCEGTRSV